MLDIKYMKCYNKITNEERRRKKWIEIVYKQFIGKKIIKQN